MSQEITIQTSTLKKTGVFLAIIAIAIIGIFSVKAFSNNQNNPTTAAVQPVQAVEVQNVKLSVNNYQYNLEPSTLKKGIPVRMEVDLSKVNGCLRSIVIPAFNIRKNVRPGDNLIEFTPDKAGTFSITCSMGMGKGQFIVTESAGSIATGIQLVAAQQNSDVQQINPGGSCSMGGCGCRG